MKVIDKRISYIMYYIIHNHIIILFITIFERIKTDYCDNQDGAYIYVKSC